ncbi:MAG: 2,3-bisphosphoglycerate-independent phosphoglycerate mutase [Spartobacteria bacterium]|nr:2,3-bisphosphoglycerate-independent phosphoglycerate mutase [Spartobacteria bacterium]
MDPLKKLSTFAGPRGPVVLVIMDGVGIGACEEGDIVREATTPHLDWLKEHALYSQLKAHGTAVGLPSDDDMGNSEVGHNAIGCGRVFEQGAKLVNQAIETRGLFEGDVWKDLIANCKANDSTLHFIGLLSDGNVHSHIDQLKALLDEARAEGVMRVRVHPLLDGRDVPSTSALVYVDQLEEMLQALCTEGADYRVGSGGGRMKVTMDRYEADWRMVALGWKTHVKGEGRQFASAREAIETYRKENPDVIDQDLPAFVIGEDGKAIGAIQDGDSVIFFNFRGDRGIEISRAFEEEALDCFDRGPRPDVKYAGMMQYDGDLLIPKHYLVSPPAIDRTMGEYLVRAGVRQMAISETQKFGHVTYFFNGNRSGKFDEKLEEYIEIPSDRVPFEERPWMKSSEITDRVIEAIGDNAFAFIRLNYPNGDMVGHTGVVQAVEIAVEAVDLNLARVMKAVKAAGGILVVSADHGNSDDMYQRNKKTGAVTINPETGEPETKTSHSLNPVPVFVYDPEGTAKARLSGAEGLGISSLAATCLNLLGYQAPEGYDPSIVDLG